MMKNIENRKREIKERIASLEQKRDDYYGKTAEIENKFDNMREQMISMQEKLVDYKKKGDTLDSYMQFLEKQLVIEALEQHSYSIENFDRDEQDRLMVILRRNENILFDWYVKKKQEGYEFNHIEPLHKILKEDYEDFRKQREGE